MPHDSLSLQAAFKYLFIDEVHALKQLAQSLPPNPVVINIGSGSGTSSLTFVESRSDLFLICIDVQWEDSPYGSLKAEAQVLVDAGYSVSSGRWIQLHGDSKDYGKDWDKVCYRMFENYRNGIASNKADLIFIDGDHSYNGCKGDILAWLPNIKSGGIMAVHDFEKRKVFNGEFIEGAPHPLPWPGVDRAVRHYLCPNYEMILKVDTLVAFRIDKNER